MAVVKAWTFADDDRDLPPQQVQGELRTVYVPALDYTQHWVGDAQVNPDTIQPVANQSGSVPDQEEGAEATARVVRRRAKKGKDIGVLPPADEEDVIKDIPSGHGSLGQRDRKQQENEDAPPRNG